MVSGGVTVVKVPFLVEMLWVAAKDDALGNASMMVATMLGMSSFINAGASVCHHFPIAEEVEFTSGGVFLLLFLCLDVVKEGLKFYCV